MSVDQIASEALRLPEKERANLVSRLLRSLPPVAFDDDEGVAEALRRDAELDADPTQAMTLRDLDSHIQQRRKS
jgi:putative addiction module component (TIGR02574 family)